MSKKINIISPGISRNNLWGIFREYLIRKKEEEDKYWLKVANRHLGSGCDFWLYDDYDDYEAEMQKLREYYGCDDYPGHDDEDEYYVDDDGTIIFPAKSERNRKGKHKHSKHRSRHKSKKAKLIDIATPYSGFEDYLNECDNTKIYYYPDYNDKYERIEFSSLLEFDEFCQEEGFCVPPYIGEKLAYSPVAHCCLNPYARERGILEIMAEDSYANMMYEACDESELGI